MFIWNPSKKLIQDWVEKKEQEFAENENRSPRMSTERLLVKYIFKDQYEIFCGLFPVDLYERISSLIGIKYYFKGDKPKEWTPELI